jgi:hypothetical protein
MQPLAAIPPYDPWLVESLVGTVCIYGRTTVRINLVSFINEETVYVDLDLDMENDTPYFWRNGLTYQLSDLRFPHHCDDELICQIYRSRCLAMKDLTVRKKCTLTNAT